MKGQFDESRQKDQFRDQTAGLNLGLRDINTVENTMVKREKDEGEEELTIMAECETIENLLMNLVDKNIKLLIQLLKYNI